MPTLTHRPYPERRDCWHIYYSYVQVGMNAKRSGAPHDEDPWEWICGLYPGCGPGEHTNCTAATFEEARAAFEEAWQALLPQRTEADFQEWRDQHDWTERKYATWERGERLPSQIPTTMMGCPCGARFDSHDPAGSYVHRGHIHAAEGGRGRP
jgi:hypothetical protein